MDEQKKKAIMAEIDAKLKKEAAIRAEIDAKLEKELAEKNRKEAERKKRLEEEERKIAEEREKMRREQEERIKEMEERKKAEEKERLRKEEEKRIKEMEEKWKRAEEKRLKREEEERIRLAEEERKRKEEERKRAEAERLKREEEERIRIAEEERKRREEEERIQKEEEERIKVAAWNAKIDKANSGDVETQFNVAECYYNGIEVEQDNAKAIEWYSKAGKSGYVPAQTKLYHCYINGIGVSKDIQLGIEWLTMAAEAGDEPSQSNLANRYSSGLDVTKDESKAFHFYMLSAKQNNFQSIVELGKHYMFGNGIEQDFEKAVHWLNLAYTSQPNDEVRDLLASALASYGYNLEHEKNDAATRITMLECYKKSAKLGNAFGMAYLGHCYHYGLGVEADLFKAIEYYIKANNIGHSFLSFNEWMKELENTAIKQAESGDASAQGFLGAWYLNGFNGDINLEEAFLWLSKGASQCNRFAQYYLGEYYEQFSNYDMAFFWYKKSSNCIKSMIALSKDSYRVRQGVKCDNVMSACWLGRAYFISNQKDEEIKIEYEKAIDRCIVTNKYKCFDLSKLEMPETHNSLFKGSISIFPKWIDTTNFVNKHMHSYDAFEDDETFNESEYKETISSSSYDNLFK